MESVLSTFLKRGGSDLVHHYDIEKAYTSMKLMKDFPGDNIERALETEVVEAAE